MIDIFLGLCIGAFILLALSFAFYEPKTKTETETGSLHNAEYYFLKADSSVYLVIIDRSGKHHIIKEVDSDL